MSTGETLLKITDIPFSYSLLAIIMGVMGVDLEGKSVVLLVGAAGVLGTILSVTDPIGRLLKLTLKNGINQLRQKSRNAEDDKWYYAIKAIKTRSIGVEIDKFVSLFYLAIILLIFSSSITYFPSFSQNLQLYGDDGAVVCDDKCASSVGVIFAVIGLTFVGIVGQRAWKDLKNYTIIAGIHHIGISSEYVTPTTIENMSRSIEQNDWQTASEWGKIVEYEIKTEKGKKDFNLEAVREVYRPLFEESMQIQATAENILQNNVNTTFPSTAWNNVNTTTKNLLIKDKDVLEKINTLYKKIQEYNKNPPTLENQVNQIIQREATNFYGFPVNTVHYWFKQGTRGSAPGLWDCLRTGQHPTQRYNESYESRYIELDLPNNKRRELNDENAINEFERLWKILLEKVNSEIDLTRLKNEALEIQKLNNELKPIFEEQIKKQWL